MAARNDRRAGRSVLPERQESKPGRFWARAYFWFPLGYVIFGVVGLLSSLICLVLSMVLPARIGRPAGQWAIHRLFAFFARYLEWTGLVEIDFHDVASLRGWRGGIIAANHPCLLDVVFLVSRLPRVFCLMKSSILTNLVLCGHARLAGYVDNRSGHRMVHECVDRVRRGDTLLVFPEGTRTVQGRVNPFKMGFALIASLSGAPVQTLLIEASSRFLSKSWPFFRPPGAFPLRYSFRLGNRFEPGSARTVRELGQSVEDHIRSSLRDLDRAETTLR
ncbi:MAG: lysophospholipid acyltransferase family protein [Limisphaerales bacterium]